MTPRTKKSAKKIVKQSKKRNKLPAIRMRALPKFVITEKQVNEVARIIGTNHFYLFAHNPATVNDKTVFDGTSATHNLGARHLLTISKELSRDAFVQDPKGAALAAMMLIDHEAAQAKDLNAVPKKKTR